MRRLLARLWREMTRPVPPRVPECCCENCQQAARITYI